jgi:hypothetical protein
VLGVEGTPRNHRLSRALCGLHVRGGHSLQSIMNSNTSQHSATDPDPLTLLSSRKPLQVTERHQSITSVIVGSRVNALCALANSSTGLPKSNQGQPCAIYIASASSRSVTTIEGHALVFVSLIRLQEGCEAYQAGTQSVVTTTSSFQTTLTPIFSSAAVTGCASLHPGITTPKRIG